MKPGIQVPKISMFSPENTQFGQISWSDGSLLPVPSFPPKFTNWKRECQEE